MEDFYEELWGENSSVPIIEHSKVRVPQKQFYIDPEYHDRVAGVKSSSLQLMGLSKKEISKNLVKVQTCK